MDHVRLHEYGGHRRICKDTLPRYVNSHLCDEGLDFISAGTSLNRFEQPVNRNVKQQQKPKRRPNLRPRPNPNNYPQRRATATRRNQRRQAMGVQTTDLVALQSPVLSLVVSPELDLLSVPYSWEYSLEEESLNLATPMSFQSTQWSFLHHIQMLL